jgi:hypothetical protein
MMDTVRDVLDNTSGDTPKIIEDFGGTFKTNLWSSERARTRNNKFMEIFGLSGTIRSTKVLQHRPDLGILDDIDKDDQGNSTVVSDYTLARYTRVISNRFSTENGNVVVLGNLVHDNSLISRMAKYGESKGWLTKTFEVYSTDETGRKTYTWPEKFGPEWEVRKRDELMDDQGAFDGEYLPRTNSSAGDINANDITYWDPDTLHDILAHCHIFVALDPAASTASRADFSALVPLAYSPMFKVSYVLPCFHEKCSITRQIEMLILAWEKYQHCLSITLGCEAGGFQKVLGPLVKERFKEIGISPLIVEIPQGRVGADKHTRIRRLFPPITDKTLQFDKNDVSQVVLKEQLLALARGVMPDHDDIADALEMAYRLRDDFLAGLLKKKGGSVTASIYTRRAHEREDKGMAALG